MSIVILKKLQGSGLNIINTLCSKAICLKQIQNSQDMGKMKKVLGVQPQDLQLVQYWIANL